jgi:hypothetical protein
MEFTVFRLAIGNYEHVTTFFQNSLALHQHFSCIMVSLVSTQDAVEGTFIDNCIKLIVRVKEFSSIHHIPSQVWSILYVLLLHLLDACLHIVNIFNEPKPFIIHILG